MTAILLDALGTLLRLNPPAPRLREALGKLGFEVAPEAAERAFAAEIAYYLEHHTEGRDQSSLAELRNRCAAVLHDSLALPELPLAAARDAMLESIRFEAYPDAVPALRDLRSRGLRLVVASNWDCSLREVLARAELAPLLDEVVTSAEAGARKPDPALFAAALRAAGSEPRDALHAGDSLRNDVEGARAAGLRAVLVNRDGGSQPPPGVQAVTRLGELAAVL
ncbi:MAG TPA: HAD-IA family hydrolase [Thermoleophilaceae bacterium]|nr:HAD-IA family hydrolase [Thermoleophilaceae bacterium]